MQSKWERDGAKILANINNACTRICMRSPADPPSPLTQLTARCTKRLSALSICHLHRHRHRHRHFHLSIYLSTHDIQMGACFYNSYIACYIQYIYMYVCAACVWQTWPPFCLAASLSLIDWAFVRIAIKLIDLFSNKISLRHSERH